MGRLPVDRALGARKISVQGNSSEHQERQHGDHTPCRLVDTGHWHTAGLVAACDCGIGLAFRRRAVATLPTHRTRHPLLARVWAFTLDAKPLSREGSVGRRAEDHRDVERSRGLPGCRATSRARPVRVRAREFCVAPPWLPVAPKPHRGSSAHRIRRPAARARRGAATAGQVRRRWLGHGWRRRRQRELVGRTAISTSPMS